MRETILNQNKKSRVPRPVYTMAIFGLCFMFVNMTAVETVEALSILETAGYVALGPVLGYIAYSIDYANKDSAYPGGVTGDVDAYNDLSNQLERWQRQYNELDITQKNLLNAVGSSDLRVIRDCEADVFNVLEYDTWEEAKPNMDCLKRYNQTMNSIALSVMSTYGTIDLDVINEMIVSDVITYSDVYQPSAESPKHPASHPNEFYPVTEAVDWGLEYAGNFNFDGTYKEGEYYLNYIYTKPGNSITIDGLEFEGGSYGLIQNFTSYVAGGLYPQSFNITNITQGNYINGIYKGSFGPTEYGDIEYYSENRSTPNFYEQVCRRDTSLGDPECGLDNNWYYIYQYTPNLKTDKLYLDTKFTYSDLPNLETDIVSATIKIDLENDGGGTSYDITKAINISSAKHNVPQTYVFDKNTHPALFNPTITNSAIRISGYISGSGNDVFTLYMTLRNASDIGSNNLFFRKEGNSDVGIYYPTLSQSTYPMLRLNTELSNKDYDSYNGWKKVMDDTYNAVINNAQILFNFHKALGRNSVNDVPANEIIIMPDLLFDNYEDLQGLNKSEALFMYQAMIYQMSGQFEEFDDLFNETVLGARDLNITDFSTRMVYMNWTKNGTEEYGPAWYWISPLYGDLNWSKGTCSDNTKPIMLFDITSGEFFNMYKNDHYCIHNLTYNGEEVDYLVWETTKLEDFAVATYGISIDEEDFVTPGLLGDTALYLAIAGVGMAIGGLLLSVIDPIRFGSIGKIVMVIGILILAYWGITEYVYPWAIETWESIQAWWPF